jgi:hypothetical protein
MPLFERKKGQKFVWILRKLGIKNSRLKFYSLNICYLLNSFFKTTILKHKSDITLKSDFGINPKNLFFKKINMPFFKAFKNVLIPKIKLSYTH